MSYQAPEVTVVIQNGEYTFKADLRAYMALHEIQRTHPERFIPMFGVDDETGEQSQEVVGARMRMAPEALPDYFAAVSADSAYRNADYWAQMLEVTHPQELTNAWQAIDLLLTESQVDWEEDDQSPFRDESEQPLAAD